MASSSSSSPSSKQLWEFLQEQQKPFILEVYLSERRVMLKKGTKSSCSTDLSKKKYLHITKILKLILHKFAPGSHSQQVSSCHKAQSHQLISKAIENSRQIEETKRIAEVSSSVSSGAASKCSVRRLPCHQNHASLIERISQSLNHRNLNDQEAAADTSTKWGCKEDNKRLSPVSVLNNEVPLSRKEYHFQPEPRGDEASTSNGILSKNNKENSFLSAFLWELLIKSLIEKQSDDANFKDQREIISTPGVLQHLKNRMFLQQSKQLLFDCVNEARETHERNNRRKKCVQGFMNQQERGKVICEQISSWGNQNESQKINFNVSSAVEDKDYLQQLKRKIAIEIGDAIMNEIIQEVITSLLH